MINLNHIGDLVVKTGYWWLRSPGNNSNNASKVNGDGWGNNNGNNVNNDNDVGRPDLKNFARYFYHKFCVKIRAQTLQACFNSMKDYIEKNLALTFNCKTQIMPISQGVDYLGFHFYLVGEDLL